MFLSAYLSLVLTQPVPEGFQPENTADRMTFSLSQSAAGSTFDWSDQENRVRGTISPAELSSGDPFQVSVAVGAFEGQDFEGPVSLTLRALDGEWRDLKTIQPQREPPRTWAAEFVPPASGRYQLEVAFRSSRMKSIRGPLDVGMGRVSKTTGLSIGIGAILLAVVYGLFVLFGKKDGATSEAPGPPPPA
ncbi:MAG: hypothetical protein SFW67_24940 [Myxococcaceae bacterium]|nr:hypothetical protein [Myxococcaceae bacterium]